MNAKSDKPRRKKTAEKPPKDRRRIAEGSPKGRFGYMMKIRKLRLFMGGLCNTLIFRWVLLRQRRHKEPT